MHYLMRIEYVLNDHNVDSFCFKLACFAHFTMLSCKALGWKLIVEPLVMLGILITGGVLSKRLCPFDDYILALLMMCTGFSCALYFIHPCYTFSRWVCCMIKRKERGGIDDNDGTKMHVGCLFCWPQEQHVVFEFLPFIIHCAMLIGCFVEQVLRGPNKEGLSWIYLIWRMVATALPFLSMLIVLFVKMMLGMDTGLQVNKGSSESKYQTV